MGSLLGRSFDIHVLSVQCKKALIGTFQSPRRACYEIVYKIDGKSRQFFPDRTLDLIPDSIYIIPKHRINSYTVTEPGTVIDILFDIYNDADFGILDPEIICLSADNRYKSLFLSAASLWQVNKVSTYLQCKAVINDILSGLNNDRERQYLQSKKYHSIALAVEYIKINYRNPITIPELCGMCGISDEYLRRLFHEYFGQPPLEYVNGLRLGYARELLLDGSMSVSEVAQRSGFESANYFSRLFKKKYKVSPSRINEIDFIDPNMENIDDGTNQ